ncbi:MAG: hypothetical protein J2P51_06315, partial [Hyphomicrobiaceae bacterium]|nr:hypothetical protein [Hyphomicrobiaceae bacterium]
FSLVTFYFRRVRRILPALLCIYFASTVLAALLMLLSDMAEFGRSLVSFVRLRSKICNCTRAALDREAAPPGLSTAVCDAARWRTQWLPCGRHHSWVHFPDRTR